MKQAPSSVDLELELEIAPSAQWLYENLIARGERAAADELEDRPDVQPIGRRAGEVAQAELAVLMLGDKEVKS